MKCTVNGATHQLDDAITVDAVVDGVIGPDAGGGIAVAVNDVVVPRSAWSNTTVVDGARIEVVVAVQGG